VDRLDGHFRTSCMILVELAPGFARRRAMRAPPSGDPERPPASHEGVRAASWKPRKSTPGRRCLRMPFGAERVGSQPVAEERRSAYAVASARLRAPILA